MQQCTSTFFLNKIIFIAISASDTTQTAGVITVLQLTKLIKNSQQANQYEVAAFSSVKHLVNMHGFSNRESLICKGNKKNTLQEFQQTGLLQILRY